MLRNLHLSGTHYELESDFIPPTVRSCVRVPWGKLWGGWYEPPPALSEFADVLAGGTPLLIHRRRVPDESFAGAGEQWLTWGADAPVIGPRVWSCLECARGLRPGRVLPSLSHGQILSVA